MTFRELHTEIMTDVGESPETIIKLQRQMAALSSPLDREIPFEEEPAYRLFLTAIIKAIKDNPELGKRLYKNLAPKFAQRIQQN